MMLARFLFLGRAKQGLSDVRLSSYSAFKGFQTDELGLPRVPLWSVHALIGSYPSPTLSKDTLTRLHDLAALVPPAEDSEEFMTLKREMEDLVRLVEAVRMAPRETRESGGPVDGGVWPTDRGTVLEGNAGEQERSVDTPPSGRELLRHAQRTQNGFYLIDNLKNKI